MRLSSQQAKAIVAAQLNADAPIAKIRSKVGLKEHTIRYALDRAKSSGIIERRYFINLFKLGLLQHEVFFSLSSEERGSREALLLQLRNSENISWIGRLGGDYQFGINICARDLSQTISFFDQLSATHGRGILERTLSLRVSLTYFGNRYLAPLLKQLKPLSYRHSSGNVEIDQTDHTILAAITTNGDLSGHQLARTLGIPQSTLDYRFKRLRSAGVIVASYYAFNGAPLGVLSFLCLIVTRGMSATLRDRIYDFCLKNPEIVLMIESIGSWDFEFVIDAFSAQEAMKTSERIGDHFGREIQSLKMIPIFSYPKVHEYPFKTYTI